MERLAVYVAEQDKPPRNAVNRLAICLGLAVLLAATSLVGVKSGLGGSSRFPRVLVPGSEPFCTTPPNGFLFSQTADGTTFQVCISQEGNINQINYPDTTERHTQIAFDGYCIVDDTGRTYRDYGPGSFVAPNGWGPATLTQTASNLLTMTRTSTDGRYQLSALIKLRLQLRSIFVGMTVKNIDPANVNHTVTATREVAPALDGDAADDQYNAFGQGADEHFGRTGQAFQSPGPHTNSLLFGPTQADGFVASASVVLFQAGRGPCANYAITPGLVTGGNRLLMGTLLGPRPLLPGASVNVGKFVYRMA